MKHKMILLLALILLLLAACNANPIEKLKEKAAEKVVETVLEKSTDLENVDIDTETGTVSLSVNDEDGETSSFTIDTNADDGSASITIEDSNGETNVMKIETNEEDGEVTLNVEGNDGEVANVVVNENDNTASIVVNGEDGETTNMQVNSESDIRSITGFGFEIALPDGLINGVQQRIDSNGEETMISTQLEVDNLTDKEFFDTMHENLVAQGFVYQDLSGENLEKPDPSKPLSILLTNYKHPDGYLFVILWQQEQVLLSLTRE